MESPPPKIEPKWRQDGAWTANKLKNNIDPPPTKTRHKQRRQFLSEKVANKAPTWLPKWSQDGQKIDSKIDHVFDVSWNRFSMGLWWIFGTKMELSWHQNGTQNRYCSESEKPKHNLARYVRFAFGGWKLGLKIDQTSIKKRPHHGKASWHRMFIDFGAFWTPSWDPN